MIPEEIIMTCHYVIATKDSGGQQGLFSGNIRALPSGSFLPEIYNREAATEADAFGRAWSTEDIEVAAAMRGRLQQFWPDVGFQIVEYCRPEDA